MTGIPHSQRRCGAICHVPSRKEESAVASGSTNSLHESASRRRGRVGFVAARRSSVFTLCPWRRDSNEIDISEAFLADSYPVSGCDCDHCELLSHQTVVGRYRCSFGTDSRDPSGVDVAAFHAERRRACLFVNDTISATRLFYSPWDVFNDARGRTWLSVRCLL